MAINQRKNQYRERERAKKLQLQTMVEVARGDDVISSGLEIFFCPPFANNMANFTVMGRQAVGPLQWGSPNFEGLVEDLVQILAGQNKTFCLGRVFYNKPDPKLATKIFVQPGFAKVPRPISPGSLNFLVIEWVPCITSEGSEIHGEVFMEFLFDERKLPIFILKRSD